MKIFRTVLLAIAALVTPAAGQSYPTAPIHVIVPWPPGATDVYGRHLQAGMEKDLGKPLVFETKPGANGTIGTEYVARAPADGYMLLLNVTSSIVMAPLISSDVKFDVERDFAPISGFFDSAWVFIIRKGLPVNTLSEFVEYAKANPGKASFGSPGSGSIAHLLGESVARSIGAQMNHVAYRGFVPVMQALNGGELDSAVITVGMAKAAAAKGDIKILAYDAGEKPDGLPPIPELVKVLPGFETLSSPAGFWAPAKTPKPIVERLSKSIRDAAAVPETRAKILEGNLSIIVGTPEDWAARIAANQAAAKKLIGQLKAAGVKFE